MTMLGSDSRQTLARVPTTRSDISFPAPAVAGHHHRFTVGDFDVTVLSDGFITVPGEVLIPEGTPDDRSAMLARLGVHDGVVTPRTNIPLIRRGSDVILIDIGAGGKYQPTDGLLSSDMRLTGVDPASVTKVVFSHAHPDHIWATLLENDDLRYANATYYVGAAEWTFWMDPDYLVNMPTALHDFAQGARRDLGAVRERAVMLRSGDEIVPGLRALDTPGHTPGHLSFEMSGGEGLLISVDAAVHQVVSFEHPDWRFGYDTLPEVAIATRRRLLDRAAADRVRLLGYHWQYPGLGRAERWGDRFKFASAV